VSEIIMGGGEATKLMLFRQIIATHFEDTKLHSVRRMGSLCIISMWYVFIAKTTM
jgi:hypothetical protein